MIKVNNRNTKKRYGIKTAQPRQQSLTDFFLVNFTHISHFFLVLRLLTLDRCDYIHVLLSGIKTYLIKTEFQLTIISECL